VRLRAAGLAALLLLGVGCGGKEDATRYESLVGPGPYVAKLPPGWRDRTEQEKSRSPLLKGFYAGPKDGGFTANVNVIEEKRTASLNGAAVAKAAREQIKKSFGAFEVTRPREGRLDGEPAFSYGYRLKGEGRGPLRGETLVSLHGEAIYYVTLTARPEAFPRRRAAYRRILRSWGWQ